VGKTHERRRHEDNRHIRDAIFSRETITLVFYPLGWCFVIIYLHVIEHTRFGLHGAGRAIFIFTLVRNITDAAFLSGNAGHSFFTHNHTPHTWVQVNCIFILS
jgi:hypothetical protein